MRERLAAARRAFTVTEILIALLVLSLALAPVLFMFPAGARRTAFGEAQLRAHLRAQTLLAQSTDMAIRTGFTHLPQGEKISTAADKGVLEVVDFERVAAHPGLWIVKATVEWESPSDDEGTSHVYSLQQLLHQPDSGLVGDWELSAVAAGGP